MTSAHPAYDPSHLEENGRETDLRRDRRAENERDYIELLGREGDVIDALCECGRATCYQTLRVTKTTYRHIRTHPRRFLVSAGHEHEDDHVVSRTNAFMIVET